MTTPIERRTYVAHVHRWLSDLAQGLGYDEGVKKPVPKWLRQHARRLLRHYPTPTELDMLGIPKAPEGRT